MESSKKGRAGKALNAALDTGTRKGTALDTGTRKGTALAGVHRRGLSRVGAERAENLLAPDGRTRGPRIHPSDSTG